MEITIGEFKDTGVSEIDIELVVSKWNHLWWLFEWQRDDSWRIIKHVRKDSGITEVKLPISEQQASELILTIGLISSRLSLNGHSWRTEKDMIYLEEWRHKRYSNK